MQRATGASILSDERGMYGVHLGRLESGENPPLADISEVFSLDAYNRFKANQPQPSSVFNRRALTVLYGSETLPGSKEDARSFVSRKLTSMIFGERTDMLYTRNLHKQLPANDLALLVSAWDANSFGLIARGEYHGIADVLFYSSQRRDLVALPEVPELALCGLTLVDYPRFQRALMKI